MLSMLTKFGNKMLDKIFIMQIQLSVSSFQIKYTSQNFPLKLHMKIVHLY